MTPEDPVPQRIGFEERDAAIEALQEHHSRGRLDAAEFEERMTKALEARTAPQLAVLFRDLPGPHPTFIPSAPPVPQPSPLELQAAAPSQPVETPWFAQWWMILVAVGITAGTSGNLGFLIPMTAIWLWVIYPSIEASKQRRAIPTHTDHAAAAAALPEWQRARIIGELRAGRTIEAIKMYREFTGAGLLEAKQTVELMQRQIGG